MNNSNQWHSFHCPQGKLSTGFLSVRLWERELFKLVVLILPVIGNDLEYGKEAEKEREREIREYT